MSGLPRALDWEDSARTGVLLGFNSQWPLLREYELTVDALPVFLVGFLEGWYRLTQCRGCGYPSLHHEPRGDRCEAFPR